MARIEGVSGAILPVLASAGERAGAKVIEITADYAPFMNPNSTKGLIVVVGGVIGGLIVKNLVSYMDSDLPSTNDPKDNEPKS